MVQRVKLVYADGVTVIAPFRCADDCKPLPVVSIHIDEERLMEALARPDIPDEYVQM